MADARGLGDRAVQTADRSSRQTSWRTDVRTRAAGGGRHQGRGQPGAGGGGTCPSTLPRRLGCQAIGGPARPEGSRTAGVITNRLTTRRLRRAGGLDMPATPPPTGGIPWRPNPHPGSCTTCKDLAESTGQTFTYPRTFAEGKPGDRPDEDHPAREVRSGASSARRSPTSSHRPNEAPGSATTRSPGAAARPPGPTTAGGTLSRPRTGRRPSARPRSSASAPSWAGTPSARGGGSCTASGRRVVRLTDGPATPGGRAYLSSAASNQTAALLSRP